MRHLKTYNQLFESQQNLTPKQKEFLDRYTKGTWSLNPKTGLVDVEGDFDCHGRNLKSLSGVRFGHISGGFWCSNNQLTSLDGAPQSVGLSFSCTNNQLTSLEGAPQSLGVSFYCNGNQLTSLEGSPQSLSGDFYCYSNQLTSLEGAPESVDEDFICTHNKLASLEGAPKFVGREFQCDVFQLAPDEWNPSGWLKAAQESEEAAKLLVPFIPEQELDNWMRKHPLDLDLLNPFPEIKAGVLKRTGVRDVSKLASIKRRGLV